VDYLQGTMARVSRRESQSKLLMSEASTDYMNESDDKEKMIDREVLRKMKDAYVECENPNDMLYKFEGTMGLGGDKKGALVPLGPDQMLLRGSSMRNTDFAYGLVVFTGHETKIMKNSVKSRAKFSKLELSTNNYIFMIVLLQFIISVTGATFNTIWTEVNEK
jgi:magnesium-transporting ATPase (P-type)